MFMERGQELSQNPATADFVAAAQQYERAVSTLVGEDFRVPTRGGFISPKYLDLDEVERSMLMSACAALGSAIFNASVVSGYNDDVRVRTGPLSRAD